MSQKQYRFVVVEDPTTDRVLIVDTDYKDDLRLESGKGKHRVIAVDAEPLSRHLSPTLRPSLRQIDEICDSLNDKYLPKYRQLHPLEALESEG